MNKEIIRPINFGLLGLGALLLILLLPLFKTLLVSQETSYKTIPLRVGSFTFQAKEFFHDRADIDFVFMGSSGTWTAIDHKVFGDEWKKLSGENVVSRTFGHNWVGEDIKYLQLVDLVKSRNIKYLVLSTPGINETPHPAAKYIWNIWEDDGFFWELPLNLKLKVYSEQLLVMPRLIYSEVVGSLKLLNDRGVSRNSGSVIQHRGFKSKGAKREGFDKNLSTIPTVLDPESFVLNKGEYETKFLMKKDKHHRVASIYLKRVEELAKEHGIEVIYLDYPIENHRDGMNTLSYDSSSSSPIISVPLPVLFKDMDQTQIQKYFKDSSHLNSKGAAYFTRNIVPLLKHVIEGEINESI